MRRAMRISSLYRYPVKGLSPERLLRAELKQGTYFPGDRLFAIENGPSGFDPRGSAASAEDQVLDADAEREPRAAHHPLRGPQRHPRDP